MALSVSPAVKIFALLAFVVAVVAGGGMVVVGGQQTTSAPLADPAELIRKKNAAAADAGARTGGRTASTPKRASKLVPTPQKASRPKSRVGGDSAQKATKSGATVTPTAAAKPQPTAAAKTKLKAKPASRIAANGLPIAVARALTANAVVVVALYGDDWKIDSLARDEAGAGARVAGAAFVALDVTSASAAAEALMLKYDTVFRAPSVLVFRRGGEIAFQLDGFRDRDTVAQAAANARA